MKYTASEKIDIDKIKEEVNKKGFSDRVKKYIGSALLAAQIVGVSPALASNVKTIQADLQSNITQVESDMGQIFSEVSIKDFVEKMDIKKVKNKLHKYDPEYYTIEELNEEGFFSDEELRSSLLVHEVNNYNENELKKVVKNMPIADVKQRLKNEHKHFLGDTNEQELREDLLLNEQITDKDILSQKRAELSIKKYGEYLDGLGVSADVKQKMLSNLKQNLKAVKMGYIDTGLKGAYFTNDKTLKIRSFGNSTKFGDTIDENDLRDIWAHEMTHAATTTNFERDLDDMCEHDKSDYAVSSKDKRRVGFIYMDIGGTALTEGMTEYFSNKLLEENGKKSFVIYPMFVSVVKDLVNLYGEKEVLNAFVNSPERLEELMAKDGQCLVEFMERLDECYLEIYNPKDIENSMSVAESMKLPRAQKKWNKMGNILEEIREKRLKENPGLVLPESNWKSAQEFTQLKWDEFGQYAEKQLGIEEDKSSLENEIGDNSSKLVNDDKAIKSQVLPIPKKSNKVVEWLKNLKEKITSKFKKDDKPLLLNSGEELNSSSTKRNDFIESIKVNEEDLITQNVSKSENVQMQSIEMEDDELVL